MSGLALRKCRGVRGVIDCVELIAAGMPGGRCPRCQRAYVAAKNRRRHGSHDRGAQERFRRAVLARDGQRCTYVNPFGERCPATTLLAAHHVVGIASLPPGARYDSSYGRTLCRDHHPSRAGGPGTCELCGADEGTPASEHMPGCDHYRRWEREQRR